MADAGRANIVVVVADEWRGGALGHLGDGAALTPSLDRLVAGGDAVSFRHAFCQAPVCTPSRCSFLTGRYPHVRGHRTQRHLLQPDEPHVFGRIRQAGYRVWWAGGAPVAPDAEPYCDVRHTLETCPPAHPLAPDPHHDQAWRPPLGTAGCYSFLAGRLPGNLPDGTRYDPDRHRLEGAIDWIRDRRPRDRPFCAVLNLSMPHPPYGVEEPWYSAIARDRRPLPVPAPEALAAKPAMFRDLVERLGLRAWPEERWRELRAVYYGMCARVDDEIGRLIACLREEGLYEDTAILFHSDHGDYAGDYGLVEKSQNTFEDALVRVPLVFKPPAALPHRGGARDALVELVDVTATLEDLAGLERGNHFGRSLLPHLDDEAAPGRDAVFAEGGRLRGERHCMELEARQDPEGFYFPRMSIQREEGPAHGKAVMCRTARHKYVYRLYERDELYDLEEDPGELRNRAGDPALAAVQSGLQGRVLRFMVETGDVVPVTA